MCFLLFEPRFQASTDVSGQTSVKSSVQRSIRTAILTRWKIDTETLEQIWPKKEAIILVKWSVVFFIFIFPSPFVARSDLTIAGRGKVKKLTHRPDSREHISIYTLHGEPLFFQHFDGPFFPTLRLLHKCT